MRTEDASVNFWRLWFDKYGIVGLMSGEVGQLNFRLRYIIRNVGSLSCLGCVHNVEDVFNFLRDYRNVLGRDRERACCRCRPFLRKCLQVKMFYIYCFVCMPVKHVDTLLLLCDYNFQL